MGAIAYLDGYYEYTGDAMRELKRIEDICNGDTCMSSNVGFIFRLHTTIENLERTYIERISPFENVL